MASAEKKATATDTSGEILVAWQKYKATSADELNLNEGDIVELIDTNDPSAPAAKRMKIDPDLDKVTSESLLDTSAARHKLSVKPRRTYASSRHSPTRLNLNARWLVRKLKGEKKEGYVPCQVLQSVDEPVPGSGLPGDATFRRQAVVKELVETEQEFVKDLDYVVQNYLFFSERERKVPRIVKDNLEVIFGNLKEIADFHNTVLMEGVRYYQNEPQLLGKAFLRLERDFDKHVHYCKDEPTAQVFLETSEVARDYFDELSHRLGDDKSITEHLKLPIQRINDYQLLLKELVRYTVCLNEDNADLQKALELMLSVPHRAQDDKFTSNIEGYRGSIYKLGRLLAHDWFSLRFDNLTKERYLFLFKARILICKVRRISDDRSVFQLKDIIRLPQVEVKDYPDDDKEFELIDKASGHCIKLQAHRENIKEFWLKEIREFASEAEESLSDDLLVTAETVTPPAEIVTEPQFPQPTVKAPDQSRPEAQKKDIKESAQKPEENRTPLKKQEEKFPPQNPVAPAKTAEKSKDSKPAEVPKAAPAAKQPANPKSTANPVEKPKQIETPKQAVEPKKLEPPKQAEQPTKLETPKQTEQPKAPEVKPSVETVKRPEPIKPDTSNVQPVSNPKPVEKQQATEPVQIQATTAKGEESKTVQLVVVNPKVTPVQKTASESKLVKSPSNICVGVELNVDKEDMSKKYARTEGYGDSSSYSRRSASSYSTEGLSSSRYGTDASDRLGKYDSLSSKYGGDSLSKYSSDVSGSKYSTEVSGSRYSSEITGSKYSSAEVSGGTRYDAASKYGTDSTKYAAAETTGTSKYEQLSAKYGRTLSQTESDGYGSTTKYRRSITDSADGDGYNYRRSVRTEVKGGDDNGDSYSYTRRSVTASAERSTGGGEDDDYGGYSSRRSLRSERKSHDVDDGGDYSYRKRSIKSSLDDDPDAYVAKIRGKTNDDDSGDYRSSYSRRYKGSSVDAEEDSSYARKKKSIEHDEDTTSRYKSSRTAAKEQAEENVEIGRSSKYSRTESYDRQKSSRAAEEVHQEESSAKSKYSRTDDGDYSSEKQPKASSFMAPPEEKPLFVKTCIGSNIELTDEQRAELNKPVFLVQLKDTEVMEDTYLRFMVKIKGEPKPSIAFYKDEVLISTKDERIKIISDHSEHGFYELVIPDVKFSDAGTYKCVSKNTYGESVSQSNVTVTDSKSIFDDLLKETENVQPGEKPVFVWRKDGLPFEPEERFKVLLGNDEDSLALIFQHVRPEDAGLYTCVAQTSSGNISCSAELTVQGTVHQLYREPQKPSLIIEKRDAIVTAGTQAMIEMQCKGYPKPSVKLMREGKTLEPSSKYKFLYEDDETLSLVIKNVQESDAGKYEITAENELGVDTTEMNLIVKAPPKILNKIEDISIAADETLKMTVEIEGIPEPKVQFYKDGQEIKENDRFKIVKEGNNYSVVVSKTVLKDTGSYSVVAINELAQVSQFWKVDVYTKPKIIKKLGLDRQVSQGEIVELKLQIESKPPPEITWYKNDKEITEDAHYSMHKDADGEGYILKISGAVTTDSASYKVRAKNIYGTVEDDVRVDVKCAPKITKHLQNMTVTEHDKDVTFDVKVEAFPKPTVKWYLDEMEISETRSEFTRIESDDGIKLVINEVTSELSGQYSCKLSNDHGFTESSAKLTVNCKPRFIKQLQDMTVEEGATLHLEVEVDACPEPSVKWLRNGKEVSADARIKISRDSKRYENYNLAVNLVKYEDQGEYEVVVTNSLGTVSCKNYVTVHKVTHSDAIEETEEPPKKLKVQVVEDEPSDAKQGSKKAGQFEIEEISVQVKSTFEVTEQTDLSGTPELANYENMEIIETSSSIHIEESTVPRDKTQRGKSVQIEELQEFEWGTDDVDVTETYATVKPKRGKSYDIEEVNVVENVAIPQTPSEEDVPQLKSRKSISATIEEAITVEEGDASRPKSLHEEDVPRAKPRKSVSATIEAAIAVDNDNQQAESKRSGEEDVPKAKVKKGISAHIEEAVTIEEIIEEKTSTEEDVPRPKSRKSISATIEEAVSVDEGDASKPKSFYEEDVPRAKPRKSVSATIEEARDVDDGLPAPKTPIEEDVPRNKVKRGISATVEEATTIEELDEPQTPFEENVPKSKLQRGISAQKERAVMAEEDEDFFASKTAVVDEEMEKPKLMRGVSATKEMADIIRPALMEEPQTPVEEDLPSPIENKAIFGRKESIDYVENEKNKYSGKQSSRTLDRRESQTAKIESVEPEAVPKITDSNIEDRSQYESLDVSYVVKGTANPPPTATWSVDGKVIKPNSNLRMTVSESGEEFRLDIKKLDMKDGGVYQCKLSNPLGEDKKQAKLDVIPEKELRRPKLKKGLEDQRIVKKQSVTFKAVVVGDPIPDATWYFDDKELTADEYEKYKIILETEDRDIEDGLKECTYSLTIPRTERSNSGTYKLKAKNKWGELESSAHLTIVLKPEIEGPQDVSVVPGDATEFKCIIQANPAPVVTWSKDDRPIKAGDMYEIIEDVPNESYKLIVKQVALSDEGYIRVTAKNDIGESTSEARMKILKEQEPTSEKPKFITGLTDQHVQHGGEITVMVRADGLPKPQIRWYRNDKQIDEHEHHKIETHVDAQVTSSLTISDYNEGDIGIYKVTAVNVVGEDETIGRISMLQTPPTFGKRLERSVDVNEGEPLELKAKIDGSPKPTVAWYKDGERISPDDDRIKTTLLPDGTVKLNIDKCLPGDSGAYKLVVKNANGETAGLCAVAINPKPQRPKFVKCIKDQKLGVGQQLVLEAQVTAYPPPEIKWLKDGVPIRQSSNVHVESHPDGKIALVVDVMKPENAGVYTLEVSNKLGEITGDAKVEIEKKPTKPEFTSFLVPLTVVEGFPVKMEVKAKGFPAPEISWYRNGAEVVPDNKHIKITDLPDGTSCLILDNCDKVKDALEYKAIARNNVGETETSAPLKVTSAVKDDEPEERPMFLHGLKDVITDEGQPLVIEAPFTGNPIPSVKWTKDGEPIEPSDRILLTCDGRKIGLRIDNAQPSDAGRYGVLLENPLGKDSSEGKASVHKVYSPPSFLQRFTDLQQLPNRDAKFPCRVSGVPQPEVAWYKDGEPIKDTSKYRIRRDGDACCLYVLECTPEDNGVYKAVATNKEGSDACEARLDVVEEIKSPTKIEPPTFLKKIGDAELYKGMTAKFTACATGIPEPEVEWYKDDLKMFPSQRIRMEMDRAGLLRLTISGIDQDDLGKYSCKIFNEHGSDICHAHLRFDDGMDSKPKKPMADQYTDFDKFKKSGSPVPLSDAPIISRMTDRRCTLSWKPSIPSGPRAPVTYQLEMLELPTGEWFTVRSGIRNCVCDVRNLEPFRDYKFRVRVENKYGVSEPSPYAVTHREKLEPEPPKWTPYLPSGTDFRPDSSFYFPKDFDIERPPHDNMAQAPRFLRQEHDTQYGIKDQNTNLFWFVYGYPKPKMTYYFNDDLIESGGRFDMSYTRNGQATLFINKMLDRDVGWYEAVASNEHGEARQRVRLEIAEIPTFLRRPDIEYSMVRGKARFEARIIGVPYPEIKWYRDWKPLAPSARFKIQFLEPDVTILTISDVIYKDEGLYSVSARNVAGSVSSSAMLHIEDNDLDYNLKTYKDIAPIKLRKKPYSDFYDLGDELGRGTQGITYHAVERINGRNYAGKMMHGRDFKPFMQNEYEMMNELRHRRLISLHDAYETDDSYFLVMELASGGELVKDYLLRQDYYTESDIAGYVRQLLEGLKYMHERGYGHMGLNIGDLLLSHPDSDQLKIADFGLARRISMGKHYPLLYGVPEYVSPECANGEGVGLGHDMWSVGIITHILLSGRSPFLGAHDRETLTRIKEGKWTFEDEWWSRLSWEARDFVSKLLVYQADGRMDVHAALRHPWLERADRTYMDEYRISSTYLHDYYKLYREWYDNASCRNYYRRRPLEGAFTHPSKMVYPPGERYTPPPMPRGEREPRKPFVWQEQLPSRSPLNYEIGGFKSESHYQNGPDTYLLQLRDVDFPVRLREYMKVAAGRSPGASYIVSDENGFDWRQPVIRERRRFTDIMDEEIDDERKARINRYGTGDASYVTRRLRHEIGSRLDAYAEAEAFLESKHDGRLPFFREKPKDVAMQEGKDVELTCLAVGEPTPVVQWFKSDAIVAESHRIKIFTDDDGRSHYKLSPALGFDLGTYKVVARNKIGQTVTRVRILFGMVPDEPDSPEASQVSDTEVLLVWRQPKHDGNSPVICYSLQYKLADDLEWITQASNIDHEFYLLGNLDPLKSYHFRLAAKNAIGWSEQSVPSPVVTTKATGTPKIEISLAMRHLQRITDSGEEPEPESHVIYDYNVENEPIEWLNDNAEDHYDIISEIYKGEFSSVLKAVDKNSNKVVIAKIFESNADRAEHIEGEFAALRSLRHERIACLFAAYKPTNSPMAVFILEKLQGADVLTYLSTKHDYTEQTVATIVTQILDGLQYLHWRGLCHLDLQPDNVVMSSLRSVQVKLVDLGSAHRVSKMGTKVPLFGHPEYVSPELLAQEPAFPTSDVWSLGVLTYVMLAGKSPFKGNGENETRQNILFVRYRFEHLFQEVTQEATRFVMLLFKRQPIKRPTPEECHENRWLLPTDHMIKKRDRAVFLGNRLKEYCEEYHANKNKNLENNSYMSGLKKGITKSDSVQEELLTTA